MIRKLLLISLLFAAFAMPATAADYYVSTSGDNNDDGSFGSPWATPSYATQQAVAGDTIYLFDGTWYDEACVMASGNATHPITLTAYDGTPTMIGNSGINGIEFNSYNIISGIELTQYQHCMQAQDDSSYSTISDCYMHNNIGDNYIVSISGRNSHYNTIENCVVHDAGYNSIQMLADREPPNGNGVYSTHITVRGCEVFNSDLHCACDLYGNYRYILIEDCEFHHNGAGNIFTHDSPDHMEYITIRNNYFHDCTSGAVNEMDNNENILIYDNVIENIADPGYPTYLYLCNNVTMRNNSYYNCENEVRVDNVYDFVYDSNYLAPDASYYRACYDASITVRNPLGKKLISVYENSEATLEFIDGKVFTANHDSGTWTPVRYYNDRSYCTIYVHGDSASITDVVTYNVTLKPANAYLYNVVVGTESSAEDDRTIVTAGSSTTSNSMWINATMQNASATYNVSVNGEYVMQVPSDSEKVVHVHHVGSSYPYTFSISYASGATPPPPPPPPEGENVVRIPENIEIPLDEVVSIPIFIDNSTGVGGGSMTISYDPEVITVVGGSMGDFTWNYTVSGQVSIATLISGLPLTGNLTFGFIDVEATGASGDSTILAISNVVLCSDYGMYVIPDMLMNGSAVIASGILLGDANSDGVVDSLDVLLIIQYVAYPETTVLDEVAADVVNMGVVDISDATLILNHCIDPINYPL